MINGLIRFSIENKLIVGLFTLGLIAAGIWSMSRVPLDAVPDITNNQVQVITQAPNLGTEDIEQFVTYPVELAMANLPEVTEIRSISRFGLSVVTIVFEDDMGTYLPRQLVSEKLNEVREEIPEGFGELSIGPISTGLGEVYQYTLKVDSAHRDNYDATELRSIQDWIVARQMAMVPGVVEINAVGGSKKQYEVAVDPERLRSMDITISDVFTALEMNNENTGGAYIEKNHMANFIRGEGLARTVRDIEQIVVKNQNGIPITIKDVATVRTGKAIRYGALTQDGEGEVVGGLVMMLKGANSNDVTERVKARMEEIQKSLPEGVIIEPLLDRSKLIAQTTRTVSTNLAEGALIVIFVLVFLLGNWRGGLVVASTIPLSLLFAFIMMNAFDVWANLMSLGAIDFGIIVDGAVIIVESTVFLLHEKVLKQKILSADERDTVAFKASSKMMNSAFFGQLIILLVFVPILALQGVEGKMFKPMALTFMFAMMGVMILCLTYVPMMSSWLIRVGDKEKTSWGDRVVKWLENSYERGLNRVLKRGAITVVTAMILMVGAVITFNNMGGEFVPQLDEGDIAFHAILKPGSSLTETVESTTKIEQIVKEKFPEVEKIVSRIGVAEVPTDPMPMDLADIFVILKPKEEWQSATTKDELVDMMKAELEQLPGINYEFTQPIEMRFNELLEGVREDVAIKLYGEDIDLLAEKAEEVTRIIAGTPGIGDMKAEATKGLPQMTVRYERHKLAQYGLNISELNMLVRSAFAGGKAGVIFEGERRFDLVVRLTDEHRKDISDLQNLYVTVANGAQIPLKEVATISYEPGPMQIGRDNTNRRVYVGINVRGRDVKSLVEEIKEKLDAELELPAGYYVRYGGAFENLERATERLKLLVPAALGLIFILIFLALRSVKQTLMIYMAIPLATIGGVFSLWLRGMPFSLSAGVGFIVLFGVAVLNGLVLIGGWNELKEEGKLGLDERIRLGAKRRIRPILLTALTDILGFLPMAISTSAGAEVQQPLATVVIGGMLTATFLTLFILPILYRWIEGGMNVRPKAGAIATIVILGVFGFGVEKGQAQAPEIVSTVEQAIEIGIQNNGLVKVAKDNVQLQRLGKTTAINIPKTEVGLMYGQYNSFENDLGFEINQQIEFPSVYSSQRRLATERVRQGELQLAVTENELKRDIKSVWDNLTFLKAKEKLLLFKDSIYSQALRAAKVRYEVRETGLLEKAAAENESFQVKNELNSIWALIGMEEQRLSALLNAPNAQTYEPPDLKPLPTEHSAEQAVPTKNPLLSVKEQQISLAQAERSLQVSKALPDISVGYFNQSFIGNQTSDGNVASMSDRFSGLSVGLAVPLAFGSQAAEVRSARLKEQMATDNKEYYQQMIGREIERQNRSVGMFLASVRFYEESGIPQSDLIIANARKSFENGAIDYVEFFHALDQALSVKMNYLEAVSDYNQAVIQYQYLLGQ